MQADPLYICILNHFFPASADPVPGQTDEASEPGSAVSLKLTNMINHMNTGLEKLLDASNTVESMNKVSLNLYIQHKTKLFVYIFLTQL